MPSWRLNGQAETCGTKKSLEPNLMLGEIFGIQV